MKEQNAEKLKTTGTPVEKWEYKLLDSKKETKAKGFFSAAKLDLAQAEAYLNKLGDEGWEVIDIDFDFLIHDTGAFVGVAKRRKQ